MDTPRTFGSMPNALDMPGLDHIAVTPSDTATLVDANGGALIARRIFVGTGGDVRLRSAISGTFATYKNIPDGGWIDGFFDMVTVTGTDATDIVAQS